MEDSGVMLITREHAFRAAQNAVRNQGYAVALHGSSVKDLDLVAVPWQETAITADACAELIAAAIPGNLSGKPERKPYGRIAFVIYPRVAWGFDRWYVDLSVMPRTWACVGCGATTGRYDMGEACESCVMASFAEAG